MPGEDIYSWSTTASSNGNADTLINWLEGQARATVNNSARSMMAAHAKDRDLNNGSIVTTGTANAQAFASGINYSGTIPTGLMALLKIGATLTNTGTATLDMDSIGAVTIKTPSGTELTGGELRADGYAEFRYDGTNWILLRSSGSGINRIVPQVFTASGTYTPSVGMTSCIIECIGGGGGGAGVYGGAALLLGGGGGGGGGYSRKIASAVAVGASQAVTIGAAGTGGLFSNTFGGPGGTTSVGSLCIANGGGGGINPYQGANFPTGGAAGAVGTGDFAATGSPGFSGCYITDGSGLGAGGHGGNSILGGGGHGESANNPGSAHGNPGTNYGGGGAGAIVNNIDAGGTNGAAGFAGVVIITEFIVL